MTKLCPRGKAAAKRKFKVYPSAYANAYASKICAGKIKDPSGTKRKDFRGPKPAGAKVGMAVTAGAQSGMGRLQKSGLMKAKKGKAIAIMIAVGKPKKANDGEFIERPMPRMRRIKSNNPRRLDTEYLKKKQAYDILSNDGQRKIPVNPPLPKRKKKMGIQKPDYEYMKKKKAYDILTDNNLNKRSRRVLKKSKGGDAKIKKVIKGLKKASKLHAAQAKTLKTVKVRGGGMAIQGMNFKGVY
jgi:hypothetical protein